VNLSVRFTLFLSCLSLILLGVFSVLVFGQARTKAHAFAQQSLVSLLEHEWEHIDLPQHQAKGKPGTPHFKDVYFRIWKHGILLFDSFPANSGEEFPLLGEVGKNKLFHAIRKLHNGHDYELQGYYDLTSMEAYLNLLRNILAVGCFLALILIVPLSYFSTRFFLRPFRDLASQTSELSVERLDFRFDAPKQLDEYGLIIHNFNSLLNRLQKSFEQVKRFAMSASHEIRTPLAVIIGQGEMALRRPRGIEEYRSALEKSLESAKKLRQIVNRLLFLAELERLQEEKKKEVVSLNQALTSVGETLGQAYQGTGKSLEFELPETDLSVEGTKEMYEIIFTNLIENALKYSRSKIIVRCSTQPAGTLVQIEDDGPGIPETLREVVFEPLNRVPQESGKSVRGHGLGLSIVKTCAESIRASLSLSESRLGGLLVSVSIPARVGS